MTEDFFEIAKKIFPSLSKELQIRKPLSCLMGLHNTDLFKAMCAGDQDYYDIKVCLKCGLVSVGTVYALGDNQWWVATGFINPQKNQDELQALFGVKVKKA